MSTRATYQINETTFYCHMDGYPSGAAFRFAKMIEALTVPDTDRGYDPIEDRRGGFEYAFIRGVMDAEPTVDHQDHGDTEFRYTVKVDEKQTATIRVQARARGPYDAKTWPTTYDGPLVPWINQERLNGARQEMAYAEKIKKPTTLEAALEGFPEVCHAFFDNGWGYARSFYATKENAAKIKALFEANAARYQDDNPNKADALKRVKAWGEALAA